MSRAGASVTKVMPEPGRPGAIASPIVAWYGFESVFSRSTAVPVARGRSTCRTLASLNSTSMPYSSAKVAAMTSCCTRP